MCPYPHLAGVVCPSPRYPAGMTAATITFCGARARETGVTVPATTRRAASAATSAPREQAGTAGRTQRVPKNPYQGYSDPRRCDLAADQTGRLIADASTLAAWAAARTSERASVTLAPLVPDRTTTPHTADTGQMTRPLPADGIAENGSGSRPGENQRARWTRILVTNPEGKN